mgnify:CR=1 FL=1
MLILKIRGHVMREKKKHAESVQHVVRESRVSSTPALLILYHTVNIYHGANIIVKLFSSKFMLVLVYINIACAFINAFYGKTVCMFNLGVAFLSWLCYIRLLKIDE